MEEFVLLFRHLAVSLNTIERKPKDHTIVLRS